MFEKFSQIGKDIYLYKNFIPKNICEEICNELDNLKTSDWDLHQNDHYTSSTTKMQLDIIKQTIKPLEYFVPENLSLLVGGTAVKMVKGNSWGVHNDLDDFINIQKLSDSYINGDSYEIDWLPVYGVVLYFNDCIGGEIYYPDQNISHQPNAGDLIIHSTESYCLHGVSEVMSEKRYSHATNIFKKVKVSSKK